MGTRGVGVVAAMLLLVVAWRFSQSGSRDDFRGGLGAAPVDEAMFSEQALAFLASSTPPAVDGIDRDPFRWMRSAPVAKPTPPRRPAPAAPSEAPAASTSAPALRLSLLGRADCASGGGSARHSGSLRFTYQAKTTGGLAIIFLRRRSQSGLPASWRWASAGEAEGIG